MNPRPDILNTHTGIYSNILPCNVVLIGSNEGINTFFKACGSEHSVPVKNIGFVNLHTKICEGADTIYIQSYGLCNPFGIDSYIIQADAIIYVGADSDEIEATENIRRESDKDSIAIDFNSVKLPALTVVKSIPCIKDFADKDFDKKVPLIMSLLKNGTAFSYLPKDVHYEIGCAYKSIASNKSVFFSLPTVKADDKKFDIHVKPTCF